MTVIDLIPKLPIKVKLNSNFDLVESFDINTILLIKAIRLESDDELGKCYEIRVSALKEDIEHNSTVAIPDWRNPQSKAFDSTYYQHNTPDSLGNYNDIIYVMENDDCFDNVTLEQNPLKDIAIEFGTWISVNKLDFQPNGHKGFIGLDMKHYTTEELFTQFIEERNGKETI